MWVYSGEEKRARYVLPPRQKRRRSTQGSSVTTNEPKDNELDPKATNRQQPYRYGQKKK